MTIVFHGNPFTPADRRPMTSSESPDVRPGIRHCVAIPARFLPVPADAARLRVGARSLAVGQWVSEYDDDWPQTMAMKRMLVSERRDEVVACTPGSEDACEEVARGVAESIGSTATGHGVDAFVDVALMVADDLCILTADTAGVPRLAAAVLCSPNRWRLADKIGHTMAGIHQPVARYDEDLESPVNAVLARLSVERPLWRINWGLTNHPALFQPEIPPPTPEMDPSDMWVRVEWQTLRRLGETNAILFTIRTYQDKLSDFVTRDRQTIHELADLVAKIPDDVAAYKSIAPYRERLVDYLDAK